MTKVGIFIFVLLLPLILLFILLLILLFVLLYSLTTNKLYLISFSKLLFLFFTSGDDIKKLFTIVGLLFEILLLLNGIFKLILFILLLLLSRKPSVSKFDVLGTVVSCSGFKLTISSAKSLKLIELFKSLFDFSIIVLLSLLLLSSSKNNSN